MRFDEVRETMVGTHKRITILVGFPTGVSECPRCGQHLDMLPVAFHIASQRLQTPVNSRIEAITTSATEVGEARDYIAKCLVAMNPRPEFLFFIGDDMIPQWDALIRLWQSMQTMDYDVLGALYYLKQDPPTPILWRKEIAGPLMENVHYKPGEIVDSDICGMDFTLIRSSIFDKIQPPYFKTGPTEFEDKSLLVHTEDAWFCQKVFQAGGRVGVHTGVRVGHLNTKTGVVY
jgi:hypothetical protein